MINSDQLRKIVGFRRSQGIGWGEVARQIIGDGSRQEINGKSVFAAAFGHRENKSICKKLIDWSRDFDFDELPDEIKQDIFKAEEFWSQNDE